MNIAIYSRKSIFTGKGESIENQIELCKEYASKNFPKDAQFKIYEDEGFSGGDINRPSFKQLLKDIKNKEINILICYRLDRISRNVVDFSTTLDLLEKYNVSFVSIKEQFDTTTPMGKAMVYISSVFAQLERETIAERVRDNMLQLAKSGRWLGGQLPLGFTGEKVIYLDDNLNEKSMMKLTPVKEELEVVKLMYDKYRESQSITFVANWLQDHGYKGKNGGEFGTTQVQSVLFSPLYVMSSEETHAYIKSLGIQVFGEANGNGYITYNKTKKKVIDRDITEWIYTVSNHKGVVPSSEWLETQITMDKNRYKKVKRLGSGLSNDAVLVGVLKCSCCGANMVIKHGHTSATTGKKINYYVCSAKDSSRGKKCKNPNIRTDKLDKIVMDEIRSYNKDYIIKIMKELANSVSDPNENKNTGKIKKDIKDKEKQINNLLNQLSNAPSETVSKMIMGQMEILGNDIDILKNKLNGVNKDKEEYNKDLLNLRLVIDALNKFDNDYLLIEDTRQKRLLIKTIVDSLEWDGNKYECNINILNSKKK